VVCSIIACLFYLGFFCWAFFVWLWFCLLCFGLGFGGFFSAEETGNADVCNDFIGLSGRDIVGSGGYGFFR